MPKKKDEFISEYGIETNTEITSDKDEFFNLSRQVQSEYDLAWNHQKPKKDEWNIRLKLYNNQKRDKEAVGDTTMFSIHQTVLASLYTDRLDISWIPGNGDEEVAENLNKLSEYDYTAMQKNITDYEWDWDTLFFGRGLCSLEEYIRDPEKNIYLPVPQVLDPITFLRDPYAKSVNGDLLHRGACRFYGYETKMTQDEIENNEHIFEGTDFKEISFGSKLKSLLSDAIAGRAEAQGLQNQNIKNGSESNLGVNGQYDITIWYTHYKSKGQVKKVKLWLANDRTKVIGMQVFSEDYWKLIDRSLYPTSHDWDGTSIPDLTEDKQRARAVAQNLGLKAMKADLHPMYIYDTNRITNRNDLKFGFDKFIGVDAEGKPVGDTIIPLNKARPNLELLNFIYTTLDISAQKATATSDIQQGIQSQKDRPLGETNALINKTDTRYSLAAKIFGWSEKTFWLYYYKSYKDNFKEDIDEKVLTLTGAFGARWRPLKRENIIAVNDPDVSVESRSISRAKQLEDRQSLTQYFSLALQDPTINRRWALKKLAELNGLEKDELEMLFPPTIDERIAEDENVLLNEDKFVAVQSEDEHNIHLEIHAKATPTDKALAHIETHKQALSIKKTNPEFFPPDNTSNNFQAGDPMGKIGSMAKQGTITPSNASAMN